MEDTIFCLTLEDKLYRTKYEPDHDSSHIKVDLTLCEKCDLQPCVFVCPASVYKSDPNKDRMILVSHENCLECGTCIQVCPLDAIDWKYPDGGAGVKYRFG